MADISWWQIVPALIGGGAAGALINAGFTARRNRIQPIGRRIEITPIFRQADSSSDFRAKIAIAHNDSTATFENLFIADIQVVNKGNTDIETFPFGVTLSGGDKCVHVEHTPPDRHHGVSQNPEITPQNPANEIDFTLTPFNRKDSYLFKLYVVIPDDAKDPQNIELGSPNPIKFTEMPTVSETLSKAAEGFSVSIGLIDITASMKPSIKRYITKR